MKVYLLSDEYGFQWLITGIFTTEERAKEEKEKILKKYKFNVADHYKIYEIELDKVINDIVGLVI